MLVLHFAFCILSFSANSQDKSLFSDSLECRTISVPTNKKWSEFNTQDLPITSILIGKYALIKSEQNSQGEDGSTTTIKFNKAEKAYGLNVSAVLLQTDIVGVQQTSLIEVPNIEFFKSTVEKELAIKFEINQGQYTFFNPVTGIEYRISKDDSSPKGYYFSCGLNAQLYGEVVDKENTVRLEKEKKAQQEKERVEKEKYDKEIDDYLTKNTRVLREYINDVAMVEVDVPIYAGCLGLISLLISIILFYLRTNAEHGNTRNLLALSVMTCSFGVVLLGLAILQFVHPIYKIDSAKFEKIWSEMGPHVLNNEKYIKTYMKAGEALASHGALDVAKSIIEFRKSGIEDVGVDKDKSSSYENLSNKSQRLDSLKKNSDNKMNFEANGVDVALEDSIRERAFNINERFIYKSNIKWEPVFDGEDVGVYYDTDRTVHHVKTGNMFAWVSFEGKIAKYSMYCSNSNMVHVLMINNRTIEYPDDNVTLNPAAQNLRLALCNRLKANRITRN